MTASDADADWFVRAFGSEYLRVYAHRSDEAGRAEVAFVRKALSIAAGDALLDAGCGAGRHARALADAGARVVGLDLSRDLLERAAHAGGGPAYVCGDLRDLPFTDGAFAHIVSLFTTFGYFDDVGNARQLAGLRRVARTGGGFLLDFLNAARVRRTLVPRSERDQAGARVVEVRRIEDGRVRKDVRVERPGAAPLRWSESVRLYERDELIAAVRAAGFAIRDVRGDLAGATWTADSPRTVIVGAAA